MEALRKTSGFLTHLILSEYSIYFEVVGYTSGPKVKNSAGQNVCSGNAYGTLEWAMTKCNNDNKCNWLHDHGCDGKNWRFCSDVEIDNYKGGDGCSKIKPGNTAKFNISYQPYSVKRCNH